MATRGEILMGFILLMSSIIQMTVCKLSTACAAPQPNDCTEHKLRCSTGDTITIHGGWYGYIACVYDCSTLDSCDEKDCCNIDRKDKLHHFNRDDLRELKSSCTGKMSCLFNSPYFKTSCGLSRYVYSIVQYNCVPTLNLKSTLGPNDRTIEGTTVRVKSSTSEVCTCTASFDGFMFRFYQTSDSCDDVVTDIGNAECDTMYEVYLHHHDSSTLQFFLNITDVRVELKSDHDIHVNCSFIDLENTDLNVFKSNATMEKANSTVDNTTMIGANFNTSRRIMKESGISGGGIAGIVIGCLVIILVIIVVIIVVRRRRSGATSNAQVKRGVANYSYGLSSPKLTSSETGNDNRYINDHQNTTSYDNHVPNTYNHLALAESDDGYNHMDGINNTKAGDVNASVDDYNHITN